jgi:hypothetical protein
MPHAPAAPRLGGAATRHRDRDTGAVVTIPESTKTSLAQRLDQRARERWPQIDEIAVRYRGGFAYVDAHLADGTVHKLCRLRYTRSASVWGFAIWRASHDDYEDSYLPNGWPSGSPQEGLDTACGLYFGDPTAWL